MKISKFVVLVTPLSLALAATPALAHGGGGACRADVKQLCPDITPGPGAFQSVHACLQQNAANLSPACQAQIAKWEAKRAAVLQACQAETQSGGVCGDVGTAPGAIFKCLYQNRADLSQACSEALPHRHRHHHHHHHHATPTPGAPS